MPKVIRFGIIMNGIRIILLPAMFRYRIISDSQYYYNIPQDSCKQMKLKQYFIIRFCYQWRFDSAANLPHIM